MSKASVVVRSPLTRKQKERILNELWEASGVLDDAVPACQEVIGSPRPNAGETKAIIREVLAEAHRSQ